MNYILKSILSMVYLKFQEKCTQKLFLKHFNPTLGTVVVSLQSSCNKNRISTVEDKYAYIAIWHFYMPSISIYAININMPSNFICHQYMAFFLFFLSLFCVLANINGTVTLIYIWLSFWMAAKFS